MILQRTKRRGVCSQSKAPGLLPSLLHYFFSSLSHCVSYTDVSVLFPSVHQDEVLRIIHLTSSMVQECSVERGLNSSPFETEERVKRGWGKCCVPEMPPQRLEINFQDKAKQPVRRRLHPWHLSQFQRESLNVFPLVFKWSHFITFCKGASMGDVDSPWQQRAYKAGVCFFTLIFGGLSTLIFFAWSDSFEYL